VTGPTKSTAELAQALADRMLSAEDVLKLPAPEWLIGDVLVADSLAVLFGKPGSFKSFLALDLACCVAGGLPWQGRNTLQGPALYMAAEGRSGFSVRLEAWMDSARVHELPDFHLFPDAFPLLDQARLVPAMIEVVRVMRPRMVVIDTLARSMNGGDENSTRDMSVLVDSADKLRQASGACVLLVHHTTKTGGDYRGNSSLEGAADSMLHVTVEEATRVITLSCYKQKESDRFPDVQMYPKEVTIRGGVVTSCVLNVSGALRQVYLNNVNEQAIVSAYLTAPPGQEWRVPELEKVAGLSRATTYRALGSLVKKGFVLQVGTGYSSRYALNPSKAKELSQEISLSQAHGRDFSPPGEPSKAPGETLAETSPETPPKQEPPEEGQMRLECD
jgi:predicted transcriptional regulator